MSDQPKIKSNKDATFHKDNSVSYWSVYKQCWERDSIFSIVDKHDEFASSFNDAERLKINRMYQRALNNV